ncbi:MAG TPA: hypothetical protein VFC74_01905 [Oscillospiraceae bacterium]|nr:hypothetical protein [Oscillospiraceae bacterium]
MNKRDKALFVCLIVVVLLNWWQINSSQKLMNGISQMQSEINSLRFQISNEIGSVSGVVQQIQDESRWWALDETEILNAGREEAEVKISWYLREYQEDSLVTFNYRPVGENDFTTVAAVKGSEGYFYSILNLAVIPEPMWDISISHSSNSNQSDTFEEVYDKERVELSQKMRYEYYVATTKDGVIRTGEVMQLDLNEMRDYLFNSLHTHVSTQQNRPTYISLVETKYLENVPYRLVEAHVETRMGNRVIEKWPLEKQGDTNEAAVFESRIETTQDYDDLYIVVRYSEGFTVERKIQ